MGEKVNVADRILAATFESRAIDLAVVAADLRTSGIGTFNLERHIRQLHFDAKNVREGKPISTLQQ